MANILVIDPGRLESILDFATRLILEGQVVAVPTDTIYGLAADPLNLAAVNRIFAIKRRVADRPIPLLVGSIEQAGRLSSQPGEMFFKLAEKFWPGPLTIVAPASHLIPLKVTANTGKVGLRWPRAPFVESLIAAVGGPLTGTSANFSDGPACCTAVEVAKQIGDDLALIVDGGPTLGGVASTVVEVVGDGLRLLRAGAIPESELKEFLP